jgi:4-amino-4-deoxy-L-arabinose transferase-like glycosyltransferase
LYLENEQPRAGLPIALALLTLWALVTAWCDTAQFGDNVEQYIWSHSMEWGYHKHPPLPTWGLGSLVAVLGPSRWWPVLLAGLCVLATLCLTWDVTRRLANVTVANVAALCWTLLQYFSSGIQLYNHNTVMVLCIAAVVWLALKAQEHWGWWVLVGIIAASEIPIRCTFAWGGGGALGDWTTASACATQWLAGGAWIYLRGVRATPHLVGAA